MQGDEVPSQDDVDGVLVVDKPEGWTSHDVVQKVRNLSRTRRIGHTGTLDPMATGVLVLCLGKATRIVQFLQEGNKEYEGTMQLGLTTDTQDITGQVIEEQEVGAIGRDELEHAFAEFTGDIEQVPPMFSAVKFHGRSLHHFARKGLAVRVPSRRVTVSKLVVGSVRLPLVDFEVTCSKGTYVRTLCQDIGRRLGCGACLTRLRRTRSGPFTISQAVTLSELTGSDAVLGKLIPLGDALAEWPKVHLSREHERKIATGHSITLEETGAPRVSAGSWVRVYGADDRLLSLATVERRKGAACWLQPRKVLV